MGIYIDGRISGTFRLKKEYVYIINLSLYISFSGLGKAFRIPSFVLSEEVGRGGSWEGEELASL